jgi:hypothetical protein
MNTRESVRDFNVSLIELYYRFLKKHGIFGRVYTHKPNTIPTRNTVRNAGWALSVSGYSNSHTYSLFDKTAKNSRETYVLSQLWRGYVLDNLDKLKFTSDDHRVSTIYDLRSDLKSNGTRGSKEVRNILRKYDIRILETH